MSNPEIELAKKESRLCAWGTRVTREEVRQFGKITFTNVVAWSFARNSDIENLYEKVVLKANRKVTAE